MADEPDERRGPGVPVRTTVGPDQSERSGGHGDMVVAAWSLLARHLGESANE